MLSRARAAAACAFVALVTEPVHVRDILVSLGFDPAPPTRAPPRQRSLDWDEWRDQPPRRRATRACTFRPPHATPIPRPAQPRTPLAASSRPRLASLRARMGFWIPSCSLRAAARLATASVMRSGGEMVVIASPLRVRREPA
jgi:hypothetical protein